MEPRFIGFDDGEHPPTTAARVAELLHAARAAILPTAHPPEPPQTRDCDKNTNLDEISRQLALIADTLRSSTGPDGARRSYQCAGRDAVGIGPAPVRKPQPVATIRFMLLALLLCFSGNAASGQTSPSAAYDGAIEGACRAYAAAVTGVPPGSAFAQCMDNHQCFVLPAASTYHCEPPGPIISRGHD